MSFQTSAIILAAGLGKRFGGAKQFADLQGEPLILRTLKAFEASPAIHSYVLAAPAPEQASLQDWGQKYALNKLLAVLPGGYERQDSMVCGFRALKTCDVVLVHDGARPLVSLDLIQKVAEAAYNNGAAIPGLPLVETLKKVGAGGRVISTVDRRQFMRVQTPQGFRYALLQEAIFEAEKDKFYGTDEAMLIERMGFPVTVIPGEARNLKVTLPEDLELASFYLNTAAKI